MGIVTNAGVKLGILLKICRWVFIQSQGSRPACSVCNAQSTSTARVLQQIGDILGKANGITCTNTTHASGVPGVKEYGVLQGCINRITLVDRKHDFFQMPILRFIRWDFILPAMTYC